MCPPSAIFPHNRTSLFTEVKFAANLWDVGVNGPILGYGFFHYCLKRFLLCRIAILLYFWTWDQQKEALAWTLPKRFYIADPIFTTVPPIIKEETYIATDYSYVIIYTHRRFFGLFIIVAAFFCSNRYETTFYSTKRMYVRILHMYILYHDRRFLKGCTGLRPFLNKG